MTEVVESMTARITPRDFHQTAGLDDWRIVGDAAVTHFRTKTFASGVRLVQEISELAGFDSHHPDVQLRREGVVVRLITVTEDYHGLTERDVELASQISSVARELALPADPSAVQNVHVAIDALVRPEVMPFWRAVLGYADRADRSDELFDPRGRGPILYFQQMDVPRPQRNRVHVDVWVPYDQADARVAAALAAGGRLVTDEYAPGWWVLADVEGNEACVAVQGGM